MHRFEIEQLATRLYEEYGFDPALPPGIHYLCLRMWGSATLRYETRRDQRARVGDGGWELSVPPGTKHTELHMRIACAVAVWFLERESIQLASHETEQLALSLIVPLPALHADVLEKGLGAQDIARVYNIPPELAQERVRQLLDHGSGERPSIPDHEAEELLADDTVLRGLL